MLKASILFLAALLSNESNWPDFLGVSAAPVKDLSFADWSPDESIAWRRPLTGYGQSSPVVWENRVFVTSVDGKMKETLLVSCINIQTGEIEWTQKFDASEEVESSVYVSRAAPTPVVDANGVYVFFESGDTVGLSHTGEVLWQRSLSKDYGKFENRFCLGASLTQSDDAVIVLVDHDGPSYIAGLSKKDGTTIWKTDRESRISWSSPIATLIEDTPMIIVSSQGSVDGYDPADGKLLWTLDELGGNTAASPFPVGNGRFLIGASPGQRGENAEASRKTNMCIEVKKTGTGWAATVAWRAEKANSSFGSPMAYRGVAYWVNRSGVCYAYAVESGENLFTERIEESCWATPLGVGDRVYFFGRTGNTTVLKAGPDHEQVGVNRLWAEEAESDSPGNFGAQTQYGVAVSDNHMLIRSGQVLYCLRSKE